MTISETLIVSHKYRPRNAERRWETIVADEVNGKVYSALWSPKTKQQRELSGAPSLKSSVSTASIAGSLDDAVCLSLVTLSSQVG
jgi:hypothetical protein